MLECEVSVDLFGVWFECGTFLVSWSLRYDMLTAQMLLTVTGVSLAVHMYSASYMRADPHLNLFLSYLSMFTFFMLVLVTADNWVFMLVGWEGIGVCSYLLIGYWCHRLSAVKSAQKAILVNRVSDGLLMWGVVSMWHATGGLQYDFADLDDTRGSLLGLAVLVGAMGKSAQLLFHVWLADAMEGPTPVSALIHAATLVTAGVYIMIRLGAFLCMDDLVLLVGTLTAFMAGVFGFFQSDLKRVIAFSTCSQLGYMMVSVALGSLGAEAGMCHLMTHASFKSALFLAAGIVIQASFGNQHTSAKLRNSRVFHSPTTGAPVLCLLTLLVGSLSLVGWPELSGFYSKETILSLSAVFFHPASDFAHTLLLLTALLTSVYTCKLWLRCFAQLGSRAHGTPNHTGDSAPQVDSLVLLAFSLLIIDILAKVWIGTNLLSSASGLVLFVAWGVKTMPFGVVLAGILCAATGVASQRFSLIRFGGTRWGFDQMYARGLALLLLDWGRITWGAGDRGLFTVGELRAHM